MHTNLVTYRELADSLKSIFFQNSLCKARVILKLKPEEQKVLNYKPVFFTGYR